jgi:hypothetical protein
LTYYLDCARARACSMLRVRAFSVGARPPERKNVMPSRFLISQFSLSPVIDRVSVKHVCVVVQSTKPTLLQTVSS